MTTLTLSIPEMVDSAALEHELVTALADRLRDEHGRRLSSEAKAMNPEAAGAHDYQLTPDGAIVVERRPQTLAVKLRGVDIDAQDLFIGVSSELEQRHAGLGVEIG
jgi:hypothetical protein